MPRQQISDQLWSKLRDVLIGCRIYDKIGLRLTVEGILYKLRAGCPWCNVPDFFGNWNVIFKRFNKWSLQGKLKDIFFSFSQDHDNEWTFIDGSVVKAHQHSSGAAYGAEAAMGLPICFTITGGEVHDSKEVQNLINKVPELEILIADKSYDSEILRGSIAKRDAESHIPRKSNSKIGNKEMDCCLYKYRHLVENAFARLKHFRSIATRYEKLKRNYEGMLYLACSVIWLPM